MKNASYAVAIEVKMMTKIALIVYLVTKLKKVKELNDSKLVKMKGIF